MNKLSKFEESNFYKALQDFFINADKKTFLQFLAEFYNRTEGIIDKNNIQDDLIKELRELYLEFNEKGIDEKIVKEKVNYFIENSIKIQNINKKLLRHENEIGEKADKVDTYKKIDVDNKVWSMANMGQDIKEALTGGSVAVVGENAVLTENVVSKQITKEKTNFYNFYENLLNPTPIHEGKVWYWSSSEGLIVKDSSGHNAYERIKLYGGITYSFKDIRGSSLLVSLDLTTKIGELSTNAMFTGTYTPTKDCWLYPYYYTATNMSNIMIVNNNKYWCIGDNVKLEHGKKYKRTIGDINLDSILTDILTINKNLPNKLNVQAMYEELYNYIDLKYKIE